MNGSCLPFTNNFVGHEIQQNCSQTFAYFVQKTILFQGPFSTGGSEDMTTIFFNKATVSWTFPKWEFALVPTQTGIIMCHSSIVVDGVLYVAGGKLFRPLLWVGGVGQPGVGWMDMDG